MGESETERAVGYLVKRVQQSLRRRSDAALRPTGVSMAQLAGLRAAGFVKDANRPPRGRARALELTPTGAKRLAAAHNAVMDVESAMAEGLSANSYRRLAALLTRCADNLEAV